MTETTQQRFGLSGTPGEFTDSEAGSRLADRRFGLTWRPGEFEGDESGRITSQRFGLTMRLSGLEESGDDEDEPPFFLFAIRNYQYAFGLAGDLLTMKKNTAGQKIGCHIYNASDGSDFSGSVTVYVTGDAGTQAIGTVGSGVCTDEGNGYFTYTPDQAETNYDLIAFTFTGSGALSATVQVSTTADAGIVNLQSRIPAALTSNGNMKSSLVEVISTLLTETVPGYIAAGLKKFFDVVTPTSTMNRITLVDTTTNVTNLPDLEGPTEVRFGCAFTTTAGVELRFSAWLVENGVPVVLADGDCTIAVRENGAGVDLFSVSSSSPTDQGIFEITKTSPGFTSGRLYVATITIDDGVNDPWVTRHDLPVAP